MCATYPYLPEPGDEGETETADDQLERGNANPYAVDVHVHIDDSGDAGLKFGKGSSRHLVMAACVFDSGSEIERTAEAITALRVRLGHGADWEFKHAKAQAQAEELFHTVEPFDFYVRAIIIDKTTLTSQRLGTTNLKYFAITELLTHGTWPIHDAKVVIDGKDSKAFSMATSTYFRKTVNAEQPGAIKRVTMEDSKKNVLIQLADMVAGTIHRAERTGQTTAAMAAVARKARRPSGGIWRYT
ncbi:MAG: DUF3800 domain-containing protein [Propionibacteriaceae bacterium]|jgi:hypothetical protein|nr:DUF3800 domain-containing protein [Propionibacteriaceae bacterium]